MTTAQFLSMLIAPFGALLMAAFMLFITRKDRARKDDTPHAEREPLPKQSH